MVGEKVLVIGGYTIDILGLLRSGYKRWNVEIDTSQIINYHTRFETYEVTGDVVIIGGFGLVDGFSKVKKNKRVPASIFELRNAEMFIKSEFDEFDRGRNGLFKKGTPIYYTKMIFDQEGMTDPKKYG